MTRILTFCSHCGRTELWPPWRTELPRSAVCSECRGRMVAPPAGVVRKLFRIPEGRLL